MTDRTQVPPVYNGILIRAAVIYIAWGMLAWRAGLMITFVPLALILETAIFAVHQRIVAKGEKRNIHVIGWLSAGEWVFGLGALGAALLSSAYQAALVGLILLSWAAALVAQITLSSTSANENVSLPKGWQRKLAFIVEIVLFAALAGPGLIICVAAFLLDHTELVPAGLAVGFAGLACGFSAQIRPMLAAFRRQRA